MAEKNNGAVVLSGAVAQGTSHVESPYFRYGFYRLEIVNSCVGAAGMLGAA